MGRAAVLLQGYAGKLGASATVVLQGDKPYAALLFTYGMQQINYMLGDAGRSFVVGFGMDSPPKAFHKWRAPSLAPTLFTVVWCLAVVTF